MINQKKMDVEAALQKWFGFKHFRPRQDELVHAVLEGRDVVGIMPTGGGKSLCYQLPALMMKGTAVVVSPLIALMKDQVDSLRARGIEAQVINSTQSQKEQQEVLDGMRAGKYKLIYVAPERFRYAGFLRQLELMEISFYAIDEAHCVSQWGHDFRPDYLGIGRAIENSVRRPIAAFTATATPEVRSDIETFLKLREPKIFVTGFARPNLTFKVTAVGKKADKEARMKVLLRKNQPAIIYCATRKNVEKVSETLTAWGMDHASYHGGMDESRRSHEQNRFMDGKVDLVVATNAFGMGIDRANIRLVLHYEIPGSVEAYYQEAGRAGRDGLPAHCELLFNHGDKRTQVFFIEGANPNIGFVEECYTYLCHVRDENNCIEKSIQDIAEAIGCRNSMQVASAVKILASEKIIERFDIPGSRVRGTRLIDPQRRVCDWKIDESPLREKERRDWLRLERLLHYAETDGCRQQWIQQFFGEPEPPVCEICDNCALDNGESARALTESETVDLQKILSGVARMSERSRSGVLEPKFGKVMILQMLAGKENARIQQFGLDKLSTFGLMKKQGMAFTRAVLEESIKRGYLVSTGGLRPLITLTRMGEAIMKREEKALMRWPEISKPSSVRSVGSKLELSSGEPVDDDLLLALKKKRLELARVRGNVPPFKIFSNRVLESLASEQPLTKEEGMQIKGIGDVKASRLLPPFLKVIADYRSRQKAPR